MKTKSKIKKIGVMGFGVMGSGIAQAAAMSGFKTIVRDVHIDFIEIGMQKIKNSLKRLVQNYARTGGKKGISKETETSTLANLKTTLYLKELIETDIIIEAIVERQDEKVKLFDTLSKLGYSGLLVSNTSSISITKLGASFKYPERFMGMHFMNPVPLQKGVELIRGLSTSDDTYTAVSRLAKDMGKTVINAKDKAGFGINRMFIPFLNEAIKVVEEEILSPEDADKTTICLGHKMGPIATADYIGLDTVLFICSVLEEGLGSAYKAAPLLKRMVDAGYLGVKTGKGFYVYEEGKSITVNPDIRRFIK